MTFHHRLQRLFIGLSIGFSVLALSGCGGGSSAGSAPPDTRLAQALGLHNAPEQVKNSLDKIEESIPRKGSISQSTNIHPDSKETLDLMHIEISGPPARPSYIVTYEPAPGAAEVTLLNVHTNFPQDNLSYYTDPRNNARVITTDHIRGWTVDIDGDNHKDGNLWINVHAIGYDREGDDDYLAGGSWIYVPENLNANQIALGVFVDGPHEFTETTPLTGQATYSGNASGLLVLGEEIALNQLVGDINLTAEFGTDSQPGVISGAVTKLRSKETSRDSSFISSNTLNLEPATINNGFFTGRMSGAGNLHISGNWGGHFYGKGSDPIGVAGTLGGKRRAGAHVISLILFFEAAKAVK